MEILEVVGIPYFKKGSGIISLVSKLMLTRRAEVSELADEQD